MNYMCLQLIPGLSMTVKTTSQSRVPSNEAYLGVVNLCQCKNIHANREVGVNADYAVLADDVTGKSCVYGT